MASRISGTSNEHQERLRQQHLSKASRLLLLSSPQISANLQQSVRALSNPGSVQALDSSRPHVCIECGQILIAHITGDRVVSKGLRQRKPARKTPLKQIKLKCRLCQAQSTFDKPEPCLLPQTTSTKQARGGDVLIDRLSTVQSIRTDSEENRPAYRRRKNKSSLQALVGQKIVTDQKRPAPGLSFQDLFKK